jgi:hypothetical protein
MDKRLAEVLRTVLVQSDSTAERSNQSFELSQLFIEAARGGFVGLLCAHAFFR